MIDPEAVIDRIRAAFADTQQPPRETLINNHCCECADVSAAFAEKRWTEVTLDDVMRGREIALLTAAAWRYYLPAFLIWTIREPKTVDVLQDNLEFQLAPPVDGHGVPEWFEQRAPGFSTAQRSAIAAFLDWSRERAEEVWPPGTVPPHVYNALRYWSCPE
jgi:hypothetical protein